MDIKFVYTGTDLCTLILLCAYWHRFVNLILIYAHKSAYTSHQFVRLKVKVLKHHLSDHAHHSQTSPLLVRAACFFPYAYIQGKGNKRHTTDYKAKSGLQAFGP